MKKSVLLLLLILPLLSFSQDVLTFKSTSRVFNSDNKKLTSSEVRDLFSTNPEALRLYNSGMTKKTIGNILLYGGLSSLITTHLIRVTDSNTIDQYGRLTIKTRSNVMYFVSAGVVLIAIPIKIGFSKKIKKAVSIINDDLKNPKTGFNIESTSFISNSNGVGFSITF
ncbi:hypothetical protein [Flavobacterium sp.]|uniref:hypothetical protein n=1 Tax=Flavobacterium sp. TaxID=239 RepID=UPI0037508F9C